LQTSSVPSTCALLAGGLVSRRAWTRSSRHRGCSGQGLRVVGAVCLKPLRGLSGRPNNNLGACTTRCSSRSHSTQHAVAAWPTLRPTTLSRRQRPSLLGCCSTPRFSSATTRHTRDAVYVPAQQMWAVPELLSQHMMLGCCLSIEGAVLLFCLFRVPVPVARIAVLDPVRQCPGHRKPPPAH
jgi:hypothetical protein